MKKDNASRIADNKKAAFNYFFEERYEAEGPEQGGAALCILLRVDGPHVPLNESQVRAVDGRQRAVREDPRRLRVRPG